MAHKRLTKQTTYQFRSEFGVNDESAVIYRDKEPVFSCHAATIGLILRAGEIKPFAHLLKVIRPGSF